MGVPEQGSGYPVRATAHGVARVDKRDLLRCEPEGPRRGQVQERHFFSFAIAVEGWSNTCWPIGPKAKAKRALTGTTPRSVGCVATQGFAQTEGGRTGCSLRPCSLRPSAESQPPRGPQHTRHSTLDIKRGQQRAHVIVLRTAYIQCVMGGLPRH